MTDTKTVAVIGARQQGKMMAILMAARADLAAGKVVRTDKGRRLTLEDVDDALALNGACKPNDVVDERNVVIAGPPRRLSIDPNHMFFHPCFSRVGVRIDGEERNNICMYDMSTDSYMTTDKRSFLATSIEPYWRQEESRQMRRARERWEQSNPGRVPTLWRM